MALRLLVIGAHPDDADYHAGGLAALYRGAGHVVKLVSMTNGDVGHHKLRGAELARRRKAEAEAAGAVIGAEYEVLNHHDGELLPTLDNRREVIRLIRSFQPDLLLTHRPNDYHPDHRYTGQLVQDAAYMVTVPPIVPDTPHLPRNPVIAYLSDAFQKPYPFDPTIIVDVGPVLEQIVSMLHCHESQFYEWLPFNGGYEPEVPTGEKARRDWLMARTQARLRALCDRYPEQARATCGPAVEFIEAFEVCEYGSPLTTAERARLFPW
ncbi:MAG TPA: PIG-L family deacetylase [Gemmataceae bacterium]|nr:PIG-L family deacetylase [Gemmataceae bacterium]